VRRIEAAPGMVVRRACTPTGPEVCFDARDDNCNGIIDEGCGVRTGLVQFVIAWDEPTTDVDLHVIDPNGELVEPGRLTASGLTKDRDCPGPREDCQGQNLENVFLEEGKDLPRGRYRIRIRLEKLGDVEPPVRCTFGARVGPKSYAVELELQRVEEEGEIVFEL
jgi:tRNA (guanosine-2'-O-)-methyltransferase